ncbi:hypothetical protein EC968_002253 [Mortierella alpina]|nr:hypothetical protein EC968_002253 [Mortierella alpina]
MFLVTTIVVLLVWSYCLATFSSPGYPSEILQKYTGYDSAAHGDISMVDQEDDAVHVGLLAPEQFYLSPAPSATSSPLLTNGMRRPPMLKERIHRPMAVTERFSEEVDLTDPVPRSQPPYINSTARRGDFSRQSDSWSQSTYPKSHDPDPEGLLETSPTPPPLEPIGSRQQNRHVIVRMADDNLDGRTVHGSFDGIRTEAHGAGYDCDSEDPSDHVPLGLSVRRFTVKRDGKMRYCQKLRNSIGNGWSFPANEYGRNMLQLDEEVGQSSAHDYRQSNINHNSITPLGAHSQPHGHFDANHGLNEWSHRDSFSPIPHAANIFSSSANNDGSNDAGTNSGYESYDMNDTDDPEQDHYRNRRDSDESDDEFGRSRKSYHQPTPRRFRQRGGFAPTQNLHNSEDDEAEEYLYDSDEPATIRFT